MTTYKTDLKRFVADTRAKGATPIIVSPMERRSFDRRQGQARPTAIIPKPSARWPRKTTSRSST